MASAIASSREVHLHWSRWFHCESSFELSLLPEEPGIYAVAEEARTPEKRARCGRTVCVTEVRETGNLFQALSHLFHTSLRERLEQGTIFLRYAVVTDATTRRTAREALQQWLDAVPGLDNPVVKDFEADFNNEPFRTRAD